MENLFRSTGVANDGGCFYCFGVGSVKSFFLFFHLPRHSFDFVLLEGRGIWWNSSLYCLSLVGIYIGVNDLLGVQDKPEQILVYLVFPNKHYTQHPPAVTTVATQTVRLEKNPKASRRTPPHSRNGRRIAESWLEWQPTRLLKARR